MKVLSCIALFLSIPLSTQVMRSQDLPGQNLKKDTSAQEALAQQAMTAHNYGEARAIYANLTEAFPENASYWAAEGRVSGFMGDYPGAIKAYDRALALEPKNVETITGKAYVLLWQGSFAEATVLLDTAHQLAPESADVDLAIAQQAYYQHRPKEALQRLQRMLLRDPHDAGALDLKGRLHSGRQIRVELGVIGDSLSFGSNGVSGLVDVGLVTPKTFMSLHYEDWFRFGQLVERGGANFSHTFPKLWTITASTLIGSRGDVLPRFDDSVGLTHRFHSGWAASSTYRDMLFDAAHVRMVSPGVEYFFEKPISIQAAYTHGWIAYPNSTPGSQTNAVLLRYNETIKKVTAHGAWSRGNEFFTVPTVGQFRANTYVAGIDVPVSRILTTKFEYAFQHRSSGVTEQTYSARLVFQK